MVTDFFYLAYKVDIQKLCLYISTAFKTLARNFLKILSEQIYLILKFACTRKFFFIEMLVDVAADKHKKLICKIDIRHKAFHIFLRKYHVFFDASLEEHRSTEAVISHVLEIIDNLQHNRKIVCLRITYRKSAACNKILCKLFF